MREALKNVVSLGVPVHSAARMASLVPARVAGISEERGSIEEGKRADLILLNANPLDNISATENRAGVMLKGKWHTQQELNGWLDESAQAISTSFKGH